MLAPLRLTSGVHSYSLLILVLGKGKSFPTLTPLTRGPLFGYKQRPSKLRGVARGHLNGSRWRPAMARAAESVWVVRWSPGEDLAPIAFALSLSQRVPIRNHSSSPPLQGRPGGFPFQSRIPDVAST